MMAEDNYPPSKAALLDVIVTERQALESLLEGLSDAQLIQPGVVADWSIKDILAHIAAWERLAQDRIHAALTGEPLKFPVITGDNFVDNFNTMIYENNKDVPLNEIQVEFQASHQDFMRQIESLDENFLPQKLPFDWAGDLTVQILISSNTHWHYSEHHDSIKQWLEKNT
jgi:hypothetical protein